MSVIISVLAKCVDRITYVEEDGIMAVCYSDTIVRFRRDIWQELVQILNERNATKYGIWP